MHVEFTHVAAQAQSNDGRPASFFFDPHDAVERITLIENAGFGRLIIDDDGGVLTNMDIASQMARGESTLEIALTHCAGVIEPAIAAKQLAALDRQSDGRLSLRIIAGARDASAPVAPVHVEAMRRTDEYLVLLKRLWSNDRPFDHEGAAYSLRNGYVARKGPRGADIPIRLGGLSGTAFQVAGRHATVFELPFAVPGHIRHIIDRVRSAASEAGRTSKIAFAMPLPFGDYGSGVFDQGGASEIELAIRSGSPERISLLALPFLEAGVSEFIIHGLRTPKAVEEFGHNIIPMIRNSAARLSSDAGCAVRTAYSPLFAPQRFHRPFAISP